MIRLRVWSNDQPMGWFGHAAGVFFFEYEAQWLARPDVYPLAPQFAMNPVVGAAKYTGDSVKVFFENLLPEGQALTDVVDAISVAMAVSNPSSLELLGALGRDLPGVLSLLPEDAQPKLSAGSQPLSQAALSLQLRARASSPLLLGGHEPRMSLAGAQDKVGVQFEPTTRRLFEPLAGTPSTHILKPDSRLTRYQPSAINEYACMKLARALGLSVPDVWLLRVPESVLVVARYDRISAGARSRKKVRCIHQLDGCQLLGHGSGWKYERQGGLASLPKLVAALRQLQIKGSDMLQFQRWVLFNYLIGNSDAHAKNLSVIVSNDGGTTNYQLAPFYDLLCVKAYGDESLALYIGDEDSFLAVGKHSWQAWCDDCGFSYKETIRGLQNFQSKLLPAWRKVRTEIESEKGILASEREMLARMDAVFETHALWWTEMIAP